jgi:hypothetical protein
MAVMSMVTAAKIEIIIVLMALARTITQIDLLIITTVGFTTVPAIRCGDIKYSMIFFVTVEHVPGTLAGRRINW